jgi:hypothetical protein
MGSGLPLASQSAIERTLRGQWMPRFSAGCCKFARAVMRLSQGRSSFQATGLSHLFDLVPCNILPLVIRGRRRPSAMSAGIAGAARQCLELESTPKCLLWPTFGSNRGLRRPHLVNGLSDAMGSSALRPPSFRPARICSTKPANRSTCRRQRNTPGSNQRSFAEPIAEVHVQSVRSASSVMGTF